MLGVKVEQVNAKLGHAAGSQPRSYQPRILLLGFLQDGDVGIGVFPESEKILVCGAGLTDVGLHRVSTSEAEVGECPQREVQHNTAMIEEFLELGSGCRAVVGHELGLAAQVHRVQSSLLRRWWRTQLVGSSGFQKYQSLGWIATVEFDTRLECW